MSAWRQIGGVGRATCGAWTPIVVGGCRLKALLLLEIVDALQKVRTVWLAKIIVVHNDFGGLSLLFLGLLLGSLRVSSLLFWTLVVGRMLLVPKLLRLVPKLAPLTRIKRRRLVLYPWKTTPIGCLFHKVLLVRVLEVLKRRKPSCTAKLRNLYTCKESRACVVVSVATTAVVSCAK